MQRSRTLLRTGPALLAGLLVAVVPASAEETVRGLMRENGSTIFNGITVEPRDPDRLPPLRGYGPTQRDRPKVVSPVPEAQRKVIMEMRFQYDPPVVHVPAPPPAPCLPSSCDG